MSKILKIKRVDKSLELPEYCCDSAVGFDLYAAESCNMAPYEQKTVRTGVIIEIPEGHVGLVRDRAGIVTKMNLHTAAGTFDPAYRGEVSVVLVNFGEEDAYVEKGMRIAQMLVIPVTKVKIVEADKLSETERGKRGFGSTGIKELIRFEKELKKKHGKAVKKRGRKRDS